MDATNLLKVGLLKRKYEHECMRFFETLSRKHEHSDELTLNLGETEEVEEAVLVKVQFLKLCDLDKIDQILSMTTSPNKTNDFKEIANHYVKSSTHEINLKVLSSSEAAAQIVKFRSENANNTALNETTTPEIRMTTNRTQVGTFDFLPTKEKLLAMFWSIVPREDLLLAVIVPLTIIGAMCILTIVVACLLHMCNRNLKERRKQQRLNSNKQVSNFGIVTFKFFSKKMEIKRLFFILRFVQVFLSEENLNK